MASDLVTRDARIIRASLLAVSGVSAAFDLAGQKKIFLLSAKADVPVPYITMSPAFNTGDQSDRISITEAVWEVVVHHSDMAEAVSLSRYIKALNRTLPVTEVTECAFDNFEIIDHVLKRYVSQQTELFKSGALLRVPIQEQ